jgi:raffinose/stachyose/melibiose transport system permease protein
VKRSVPLAGVDAGVATGPAAPVAAAGGGARRPVRWHIAVFLAPALAIYTVVMVLPLLETLRLAFFRNVEARQVYVGVGNFARLLGEAVWSDPFWNALKNNTVFFLIHLLVMVPLAIALAALLSSPRLHGSSFYRTALFMPTMLSYVIVGFCWKLILSPLWGIAPTLLKAVHLGALFHPWLGREESALLTLGLVSVWQWLGVPMLLTYAALIAIPGEILEAAEIDGIVGIAQFFLIRLPLLWPTIGVVAILTFVANFNSFDLIYTAQGALAGPNFSTDILGTLLYRTFFGAQLQLGDPNMGATIATMMLLIILAVVCTWLVLVQRRLVRHQF